MGLEMRYSSVGAGEVFMGKSAGCLAFLPVGRKAGRAVTDSRRGVKDDPVIIFTFPGSPALCLPARSPASRGFAEGRRFGEGRGGELQ